MPVYDSTPANGFLAMLDPAAIVGPDHRQRRPGTGSRCGWCWGSQALANAPLTMLRDRIADLET